MNHIYTLLIRKPEGKASVVGFDQPDAEIVLHKEDIIIIKVPGHKYWCQRPPGPTHAYKPVIYQVYKTITTENHGLIDRIKTTRIGEFPVTKART